MPDPVLEALVVQTPGPVQQGSEEGFGEGSGEVLGSSGAETSRRGENRANVLSVFPKNVVFAIAKLLMISPNLFEFSREN